MPTLSTYEKSGGLPADGRFIVRSNIEQWCRRDLQYTGCGAQELQDMDYFEAYLRYWEQYHLSLATSGLSASPNLHVVAFSKRAVQSIAQSYHERYGSGLQVSEFQVFDKARRRHQEWIDRAQPSVERIAATWKLVGIPFPSEEIKECL